MRLGTAAGPRDVGLSIGTSAGVCLWLCNSYICNPAIIVALQLHVCVAIVYVEPPLECGCDF